MAGDDRQWVANWNAANWNAATGALKEAGREELRFFRHADDAAAIDALLQIG
jgi:hypothetical protein